jgi:hypothetical protein
MHCHKYGHASSDCGRKPSDTSKPVETLRPPCTESRRIVRLHKTNESVKTFLVSIDIKPMICQKEGRERQTDFRENLRRLRRKVQQDDDSYRRHIEFYDFDGNLLNFEKWQFEGKDYLRNSRGDVISIKGKWVGKFLQEGIDPQDEPNNLQAETGFVVCTVNGIRVLKNPSNSVLHPVSRQWLGVYTPARIVKETPCPHDILPDEDYLF